MTRTMYSVPDYSTRILPGVKSFSVADSCTTLLESARYGATYAVRLGGNFVTD